ncbi:MAG: Lrp/AsnC family transcriptional regulator [Thermoprotei archaeon]|jgi:DNA-binding Lrp family transcriptional regulator
MKLDDLDLNILKMLQYDAKYPIERMAIKLGVSKSTIAYRIKNLEKLGVIKGYHAYLDYQRLNLDYITITFVHGRYGKDYHVELGEKIAKLPGVWGVYFVLGEIDFIVMGRFRNRDEFLNNYLEKLMAMPEVERTSTQVVVKVIKEVPYVLL